MTTARAVARRPSFVAVVAAAVAFAFLGLPVVGLIGRAPWSTLLSDLTAPETRTALRLSLVCSLWATALAAVLGLPLAWLLLPPMAVSERSAAL